MKRNVSFEEISDGRKYKADDMVKASCGGCKECSECCGNYETIILDPYDVYNLQKGLNKSFTQLMSESRVGLQIFNGLILPHLLGGGEAYNKERCSFLDREGRCSIHDIRPGFCRLFPLGRIYEDSTDGEISTDFSYYIQVHECPYENKTKVKVKQWIGIEDIKSYEKYVSAFHLLEEKMIKLAKSEEESKRAAVQKGFISLFYVKPYDMNRDFYEQFYERMNMIS